MQHRPKHTPSNSFNSEKIKIDKYTLLTQFIFFFNGVALPKGLLYTQLMAPYFYFQNLSRNLKTGWKGFFLILIAYDLFHLNQGVVIGSFLASNILFILTYMSVVATYHFVSQVEHLEKIMGQVLLFNGLFVLVAIPFLFMSKPYQEWFWYVKKITGGTSEIPRLALLTYEASYYSLLLSPIIIYFFLDLIMFKGQKNRIFIFFLCAIPLLLSLSFGVMAAIFLALIPVCLTWLKTVFKNRTTRLMFLGTLLLIPCIIWFILQYPENIVAIRINNILEGKDTSTKGRTSDSFKMAWLMAEMTNFWLGGGLGQIKHMAIEVVHTHFKYWGNFPRYDIPNAMGETLAIFGAVGVLFRLILEFYFFFKTRVYNNYYRFILFSFIFIYQFTGSFITNIAEYICWCLAFAPIFRMFDVKRT